MAEFEGTVTGINVSLNIPAVTPAADGLMSAADKAKLDGIAGEGGVGPEGPQGEPGPVGADGQDGRSLQVFMQAAEPTAALPGDIWIVP